MSDIQLNIAANQQSKKAEIPDNVETAGTIASAASAAPSPLFTPVAETAGSIASSSTSSASSSSGGFTVTA